MTENIKQKAGIAATLIWPRQRITQKQHHRFSQGS